MREEFDDARALSSQIVFEGNAADTLDEELLRAL